MKTQDGKKKLAKEKLIKELVRKHGTPLFVIVIPDIEKGLIFSRSFFQGLNLSMQ